MSANAQLRQAILDAGLSNEQLAQKIGVDPKTVERWITKGRTPYPAHQYAVAKELGTAQSQLWSESGSAQRTRLEAENSRLRHAIFAAGMTREQLAEKVQVSPKTVDRWVSNGWVPWSGNRQAASVAVGVPESELWPEKQTPEGWRWVDMTEETGRRFSIPEELPAPAAAKPLTAVREHMEAEYEPRVNAVTETRMRELMSWVPAPEPTRSALAGYQPGSALVDVLVRDGRDGVER
ncbi:MAG: hypothetical protein JWN03_4868 [Nocardia sp.]|uniref:helix-turn-helix domain-containing protein n=1 Tax=Nocardia sp. TaxID=1821 RepID=UPI00262330C9|nr:helix-turn-helix transcriptional regulator [Nocardia sp.]MCU1644593.1 hypothetical protein [Nocardia sp.]